MGGFQIKRVYIFLAAVFTVINAGLLFFQQQPLRPWQALCDKIQAGHNSDLTQIGGANATAAAGSMTSINTCDPETPLDQSGAKLYPQFVLFGDSITQEGHSTLGVEVANYYIRRLDVLNRGFGQYTSTMGLKLLPKFFPTTMPCPESDTPRVRLMTVFFGANDASRLDAEWSGIPLETYKDTLRQIATYQGINVHQTKVIFINPPPFDEHRSLGNNISRSSENTAIYAAACCEVASSLSLPCLDLWSIFMRIAGWKGSGSDEKLIGSLDREPSEALEQLLKDGLHPSAYGYAIIWEHLKHLIENELPTEIPERLPYIYPPAPLID
ncbi:hypothetical protein DV736_g1906, partial [Chaetothyriales sp. CBS 134916]